MKYHLDYPIILNTKPEFSSLYKWGLAEVLPEENRSKDQIPWGWNLGFTATECIFTNGFSIEPSPFSKDDDPKKLHHRCGQTIRAKLRPGIAREAQIWGRTRFSMFGTNRNVENIWLNIHSITDEMPADAEEVCKAWGSVSCTHEVDFRTITEEDIIIFSLYIKADTFNRFAEQVKAGLVDEITLIVSEVAGFYSEWSPGISTNDVKVLASEHEHPVEGTEQNEIKLPRLGTVGRCTLNINRHVSFSVPDKFAPFDAPAEPVRRLPEEYAAPALAPVVLADPQSQKLLASIRTAAWWVVALLAVLAVKAWH